MSKLADLKKELRELRKKHCPPTGRMKKDDVMKEIEHLKSITRETEYVAPERKPRVKKAKKETREMEVQTERMEESEEEKREAMAKRMAELRARRKVAGALKKNVEQKKEKKETAEKESMAEKMARLRAMRKVGSALKKNVEQKKEKKEIEEKVETMKKKVAGKKVAEAVKKMVEAKKEKKRKEEEEAEAEKPKKRRLRVDPEVKKQIERIEKVEIEEEKPATKKKQKVSEKKITELTLNPVFESKKNIKESAELIEEAKDKITKPVMNHVDNRMDAKYEIPASTKSSMVEIKGIMRKPFSVRFTDKEKEEHKKLIEEANEKMKELKKYIDAHNHAVDTFNKSKK